MKTYCYFLFLSISFGLASCTNTNEPDNDLKEDKYGLQVLDQVNFGNKSVYAIAVDTLSNIWVGTDSGLFLFSAEEWYQHPRFVGYRINSITINGNDILIGSQQGAFTMAWKDTEYRLSDSIMKESFGGTSDEITAFGYDPFGLKWIGSSDGLAYFDGTKWFRNEAIRNNLGGISSISSMAFRTNDCFFGTYGKYLYHFYYSNTNVDAISGASQMLGGADDPESSFNGELTTDTIFCVMAGSDGAIWFGSKAGLTKNIGSTSSYDGGFEYFLRGQSVRAILESTDKKIWAGLESGLNCYSDGSWINYSMEDALPSNTILSLTEDEDHNIWIGSKNGLTRFANGTFTDF